MSRRNPRGGPESIETMMKLFVGNLSFDTTEEELRDVMAEFEPIIEIQRPVERDTGKPRGFAFVTVGSREVGEKAIS